MNINCITNYLESNTATNIIGFATLLIVAWGLFEVRKRRKDASFGFYVILESYLQHFTTIFSDSQGNPSGTLYLLCSDDDVRNNFNQHDNELLKKELGCLSKQMLNYLRAENNQVPPSSLFWKKKKWKKDIKELTDKLILLDLYISNNMYRWYKKSDIDTFHKDTKILIERIQNQLK